MNMSTSAVISNVKRELREMSKFVLVLTLFIVSACASFSNDRSENIKKSLSDDKEYRYLLLSNGLKVMLVSDMKADKAAASLDVFAGSAQNPVNRPGLAHFLEHMLFLGTEKYPEAGAYQQFISENGGSHNAYTSFEHTNYFFEVNSSAFSPTLDRFAQFFIAPLFDETYLEREKYAVNAEYRSGIKNEERRQLDVLREIANPEHPFSRFAVGSLESLSNDESPIRDDVLAFYKQYYLAGNMTLTVLAPESLDALESSVKIMFNAVRSGQAKKAKYGVPLFKKGDLPAEVSIVPEQDRRSLSLLFPLPDQQAYYRDQPLNVIGHVLGHEGKNSIYSYLKAKNWVESLVAGQGLAYQGVTVFSLSVSLTKEGLLHKREILQAIYSHINTLQKEGIPQWVFDELQQVSELEFAYQDKGSESHTVTRISNDLHYVAPNEVLHANFSYQQYNQEQIMQLLAQINPNNMLIVDVQPGAVEKTRSKYYSTPYALKPVDKDLLNALLSQGPKEAIQLPERNDFIPKNMQVLEATNKVHDDIGTAPRLILEEPGIKLWYKGIERFKQPKLEVNHYFYQEGVKDTAKKSVMMSLYARLLNDNANTFLYDANMAGLYASVSSYQSGLSLRSYGFSDMQSNLVSELLELYQTTSFTQDQFARIKIKLHSDLSNSKKQMPYQQLMHRWRAEMQSDVFTGDELIAALEDVDLEQVEIYGSQFWQSVNIESLINGNITEADALKLTNKVLAVLKPLQKSGVFKQQNKAQYAIKRLSDKTNAWRQYDFDHNDAAYLLYWQAQADTPEETARWLLLSNILESGFYHQLRTQEQLGYIVFETFYPLWRIPGLMFIVQSPEAGVERIHQSTWSFLQSQMPRLGLMGDKQLDVYKQSLSANIQQRPKNLASETKYYERSLFYKDPQDIQFKRKEILAKAINEITAKDWQVFIQRLKQDNYKHLLLLTTNEGAALDGFERLNKPLPVKDSFIFP